MATTPKIDALEGVTGETTLEFPVTGRLDRKTQARRLAFIMLVRVILFTLILGGTVVVSLFWGNPEELGEPYVTFLFIFIAGMYVLNIAYGILLRVMRNLNLLAIAQLGCDLLVAATLVNFSGGSDSVFVLLFMFSPIAAAVTLSRRAAVLTAAVGTAVLAAVIFAGYARLLPILPGQVRLPWEAMRSAIGAGLVINAAAMFAVAFLSGYLAEQLRAAAHTLEVQQARIYDLAALNADIIRSLTSGLITVGEEGRVLTLNRTAADTLGVPLHGSNWKHLEDLDPALATMAGEGEGQHRRELRLRRGKRTVLLDCSVSPLNDHLNLVRGRIINFQDITEQRRMERKIKRQQHLASLGRMAAGIAHEIRNPLASISGSLELLRGGAQVDVEDRRLMEIALKEIDRLDGLITQLLEYARPRPLKLKRLDLGQEVHFLASAISQLMVGEDMPEVVVGEYQDELWIHADPDQLQGLLWNLVRNAHEAGEQERVELVAGREGEQVFLLVRDHAGGIPPETLQHIFEPFYTTKDMGTGLGLSAVHRIVMAHGGAIEINSEADQGTTVRISFPLASSEEVEPGSLGDWPDEPTPTHDIS